MKKLLWLATLLFISSSYLFSQSTSPTLQAGLGGITFEKGDLDAEVIAKLIAEKQNELKVRLVQTMLLNDLDNAGGVISSYVSDLLSVVLSGTKPQIKTKNVLESTVNVAVVLAFVNHYVGVIDDNERANLNKLAMSIGYVLPSDYDEIPPPSSLVEMIKNPIYSKNSYEISETATKVKTSNLENEVLTQLAAYLIDITAEALQENEILKERGLFRFVDSDWYQSKNLYINLKPKPIDFSQTGFLRSYIDISKKADSLAKINNQISKFEKQISKLQADGKSLDSQEVKAQVHSIDSSVYKLNGAKAELKKIIEQNETILGKGTPVYARQVYQDIQKYVNAYVNAFGVFDFIYRNGLQISSIDTMFSGQLHDLAKSIGGINPNWDIDIKNIDIASYQVLVNHLKELVKNIPEKNRIEFEPFFAEVEELLIKSKIETNEVLKQYEQIYLIGKKLLPAARTIVTLSGDTSSVELILRKAELQLVADAVDSLSSKLGLKKQDRNSFVAFYKLFGSIQNLDDIQSYEQFIKSFYLTLDVFVDGKLKSTLQKVIGLTTDHIEFVKTDSADYMNVDVEGMLASLSDITYDRWRPINLYFTVGGNTTVFPNKQMLDDKTISSFQYFGEKIGLKVKLRDWAYLNSFSNGETFSYWGRNFIRRVPPKQPFISDFHLLAYASGLLYNLAGTSSESNINSTMVGAGFGFSFFNGLDFNITAGRPVGISDAQTFINFGFDIRFTEYIQALGKN